MANTETAHYADEEQRDPTARQQGSNLGSDVPLLPSALPYQGENCRPASDVTVRSPSYCLSRSETSRHGGQPSNFPAIPRSPQRHSAHDSTHPINYLSGVYGGDVATPRAYNTRDNYHPLTREYNPTAVNYAGTHGASESSSPPLGTLRNRKAYSIRGESHEVHEPALHESYQVQRCPAEFFVVGRVFAILWHEGKGQQGTVISDVISQGKPTQGKSTKGQFTRGKFGEEIFSGIRRMVVVLAMSQCAWCVPITTYGGKGVAKPGVDPEKHAIVYMQGSVPTWEPDEPQMTKEPLEVEPARPDEKLGKMSRLNFGKVYTVEHNVKVRHVGMISRTSMTRFKGYATNEFRLDI